MLRIVVIGTPAPQGSKKFVGMRGGHGVLVESSKKVRPWRKDVEKAAQHFTTGEPLDEPLRVRMIFTLQKPKSAPKRTRTWPSKYPDVSKLARSTEDALTSCGLIADDARIVEYSRLAKVFPGEDPEALTVPGVVIEIESL